MAVIEIENDSAGWLVVWLEPLGEDRWLAPGEVFRIRSDYRGDHVPFRITYWADERDRKAGIENVNVVVLAGRGDPEVTDAASRVVECGHQRPDEVDRKWRT